MHGASGDEIGHREKPDVKVMHASLNVYHLNMFANFVKKLKAAASPSDYLL